MNKAQQAALAAGAFTPSSALLARGLRQARTMNFHGRSVLITGGSRGLGLVVARQLAAEGARLTLAARDAAELGRDAAKRVGTLETVQKHRGCEFLRMLVDDSLQSTRERDGSTIRAVEIEIRDVARSSES